MREGPLHSRGLHLNAGGTRGSATVLVNLDDLADSGHKEGGECSSGQGHGAGGRTSTGSQGLQKSC